MSVVFSVFLSPSIKLLVSGICAVLDVLLSGICAVLDVLLSNRQAERQQDLHAPSPSPCTSAHKGRAHSVLPSPRVSLHPLFSAPHAAARLPVTGTLGCERIT